MIFIFYIILKPDESEVSIPELPTLTPVKVIKYAAQHLSEEERELKAMTKEQLEERYSLHNKEFVNKNCTRLEDFIINDQINAYDISKLAELNGIETEFNGGWNHLVIAMMQELDAQGWDRKVSSMKEKWGELRFYVDNKFYGIEEKYQQLSLKVCESCGEPGELRTDGWYYVACRKHYNEGRGRVNLTEKGFNFDGDVFEWDEIKKMYFTELPQSNGVLLMYFHLKSHIQFIGEFPVFRLREIGFGNFVRSVPPSIPGLDRDYIKRNYPDPAYCEICGYQALFNNRCECCENEHISSVWKDLPREEYIRLYQMDWEIDNGDFYERQHTTYLKNPDHKILFTPEQLERHRKDRYDD